MKTRKGVSDSVKTKTFFAVPKMSGVEIHQLQITVSNLGLKTSIYFQGVVHRKL